jgi:hypothetical protein
MASGTADLQRDLGGAFMQSIFGALLTAGYAAAVGAAIGASADASQVTSSTQAALMKSFSSAEAVAAQYPQYASAITAGAKSSFLDGADWAYLAGIIAVAVGFAIVFFLFPRRDDERRLLAEYHATDEAAAAAASPNEPAPNAPAPAPGAAMVTLAPGGAATGARRPATEVSS